MKEEKAWGSVEHVVVNDRLIVSVLDVKSNTYCSVHKHAKRFNHFVVVSGKIRIFYFGKSGLPINEGNYIDLESGDSITVAPDVWHQFVVIRDGVVCETYWTEDDEFPADPNDIIRYVEGGNDYSRFRLHAGDRC